jgi:hypothetical protein
MKKSRPSTVSETRPDRRSKMKGLVIWERAFGTCHLTQKKIFKTTFGVILEFVA